MRKEEFLQELSDCLQGEVSAAVIQENVKYYDGYIAQEAASGRREEEVIDEIGSPRLIAKTIIDSQEAAGASGGASAGGAGSQGSYGGYGSYDTGDSFGRNQGPRIHYVDFSKWYWKLLGILLVIGFLLLGFAVAGGILTIVGSLFALFFRYAGPILVIWLIFQMFRGFRR